MGLGQLFEIKPRCCRGSLLRDELGLRQFEARNDLTYSFPRAPAGALGRLGSPNLAQAGRYFRGNLWPSAIGRKAMRIVHKPVALAWRQRASSALRARAAATLPPAFMNNSHDFCPTSARRKLQISGFRSQRSAFPPLRDSPIFMRRPGEKFLGFQIARNILKS